MKKYINVVLSLSLLLNLLLLFSSSLAGNESFNKSHNGFKGGNEGISIHETHTVISDKTLQYTFHITNISNNPIDGIKASLHNVSADAVNAFKVFSVPSHIGADKTESVIVNITPPNNNGSSPSVEATLELKSQGKVLYTHRIVSEPTTHANADCNSDGCVIQGNPDIATLGLSEWQTGIIYWHCTGSAGQLEYQQNNVNALYGMSMNTGGITCYDEEPLTNNEYWASCTNWSTMHHHTAHITKMTCFNKGGMHK